MVSPQNGDTRGGPPLLPPPLSDATEEHLPSVYWPLGIPVHGLERAVLGLGVFFLSLASSLGPSTPPLVIMRCIYQKLLSLTLFCRPPLKERAADTPLKLVSGFTRPILNRLSWNILCGVFSWTWTNLGGPLLILKQKCSCFWTTLLEVHSRYYKSITI